jgi:hypothetical protein
MTIFSGEPADTDDCVVPPVSGKPILPGKKHSVQLINLAAEDEASPAEEDQDPLDVDEAENSQNFLDSHGKRNTFSSVP